MFSNLGCVDFSYIGITMYTSGSVFENSPNAHVAWYRFPTISQLNDMGGRLAGSWTPKNSTATRIYVYMSTEAGRNNE